MATEYMIANNGRPLNGENFSAWKIRMTSTITALGLRRYLDQHITADNIQDQNEAEKINKENATAVSIMLNNIEDKIYNLITDTSSANKLMNNLTILFEEDEDVTIQEWLDKLKQMKVKTHRDILGVTSKMITIFNQMKEKNLPITEQEKVDYLLGCMPRDLKLIFISGKTDTAENLYKDIKEKYKLLYHVGRNKEIKSNNNIINDNKEFEDMMDIDLVNNILNRKHRYSNQKPKKYCHICEMNNHTTNECHFNMKNKNKSNINNKKYKNHKKGRNHHNRKNHLGFINNEPTSKENKDEISSDSDGSIYFINNINDEYINKNQTTWVYDTGASEHITNDKDILENFISKKIIMKCANNTTCEFSGYGTYKGKINNHNITLNKVLYSEKIAKNLISGIKLAESNITCEISNKNFKPQLIIKNNNKTIFKTHVNKHNNFKIKTQNNLIPEPNTINCVDKNFSDNICVMDYVICMVKHESFTNTSNTVNHSLMVTNK